MRLRSAFVLVAALFLVQAPAFAQRADKRFATAQDTMARQHGSWTPIRIAKWSLLLGSTSAAAYGFVQNRLADKEYEDIERVCQETSASCDRGNGSDAYADAALEARYQNVVRRDDHARTALLAGQVGLAASVLLFILDLPKTTAPDDIPYDPRPLRIGFTPKAVQLSLRLALP